MQKSYDSFKELLKFSHQFYLDKELFQLGSGKKLPEKFITPRYAVVIGHDEEVQNILNRSKIFSEVYTQNTTEMDYPLNSIDFLYINVPIEKQEEVIVKMYPYAKWFLTGNNFDEEVTTNIWKQSESVKLKFDKNWFFLYEQHAWTWQDTIRSRNVAHLKTDKLFESYEHDPRLYYNYDGYNKEFKEYNEKINYTDFNKFSDSECIYFNNQKFSA
tara:strand:- start:2316 stop:2960 length:645 start_codon:yes stop_codon:yes gene_type:complete